MAAAQPGTERVRSMHAEPERIHGRVALVLSAGLAYAFLFVVRYRGLWVENDTAFFTRDAALTVQRHSVLFAGEYPHGFLYTAWLASFQWLAGVSPPVFNTVVAPFVGVTLMLLTGFLCYRVLTDSQRTATLAAWMLLAIPELVFSAVRGNHEKINIAIMMMALYALAASVPRPSSRRGGRPDRMRQGTWLAIFVGLMLMNAVTNDYFASTLASAGLLAALVMAAVIPWLSRPDRALRQLEHRLWVGMAVGAGLVVWVMLGVYPPAAQDVSLLSAAAVKLWHLLLTGKVHSNPYAAPAAQWAGRFSYLLVASFRWLMFAGSLTVFASAARRVLKRRRVSPHRLLLLALYLALGLLVAVAIPMDYTGLAAGSNLEVRNFTYFALVAAPLTAIGLRALWARPWVRAHRHWVSDRLAILVAIFVAVGVVKVTLDPLVSNEWIFYTPAERQAVGFFLHHARRAGLWTGPDNRLVYMAQSLWPVSPHGNLVMGFKPPPLTQNFLWSPVVVANSEAQSFPLPPYALDNRVYDNGGAAIYQKAPESPFQP